MLSLQQAREIKASIIAYLKATFTFQDKALHRAFYDFINHPEDGMFKGPYLSLKLRFVKATEEDIEQIPLDIKPGWTPYDHQVKSWYRLSTADQEPEATIVTTGTGSGKTESFLYPILDYCYKNIDRRGIKAIILYPMNALAGDQAKRLAEAIYEDERLRGKVTAGLFIGEGKDAAKYPKDMGETHIIENRESILASPPDILLTNFKMLDYGLMKSRYHDLWVFNLQDKALLQFLVLDELHTYDGAQGTDVANLIRRLKLKLDMPQGQLCPVGTSATIGSGEDAPILLADYASKVFGEEIGTDAIITENRLSPEAFFGADEELENFLPRPSRLKDAALQQNESFQDFIARQVRLWQVNTDELAAELRSFKIVKDLVIACNEAKGHRTLEDISRSLAIINKDFREKAEWDEVHQFNPRLGLIESLFALITQAKEKDARRTPFIYAQSQLWIRELSGVQRAFVPEPRFVWKTHLDKKIDYQTLPPWFCRECGASGWLAVKHDDKERFEKDISDVYNKFFSNHKNLYFLSPQPSLSRRDLAELGYDADVAIEPHVQRESFTFLETAEEATVHVLACRKLNSAGYNDHVCPSCNTRNTMSIIGTRIATLSSITMSQTLATDLDMQDEKGRKVLAFTNAVQDAAHQAGFVEARNYRFTLRASLQKVINEQSEDIALDKLGEAFITYWKKHSDESGEQPLDAYYYRFYPKDYIGKSSPADYGENGQYDPLFSKDFDARILWEIYAEFGYDALIGRTLEKTGTSAVYYPVEKLGTIWADMQQWLRHNAENSIQEVDFTRFLSLFLQRIRTRGAIEHQFLNKFRTGDFRLWDLNWMRDSRHILNKKFGTQTRLPKLLTTSRIGKEPLDSTYATKGNWFHAFFIKSFPLSNTHTDFVNEFYTKLAELLEKSGIFQKQEAGSIPNYALNPAHLMVSNSVFDFECNSCGHVIHMGNIDFKGVGGSCLIYRCTGTYAPKTVKAAPNYYQLVYNRKRSPRIYAAEHTGLLQRKDREVLEEDFKYRNRFNSKNAMVATSTLEMGIDIGSLNTGFNNSVPPLPSNFLQRVGRAGRSSGSALIVNFAKSQSHDLFYFQEPLDMMAGKVNTPGCYLEAGAILKRHFFASCIDAWTSRDYKKHHIPFAIKVIKLETTDLLSPDFFINRILNFIKANENQLFERFKSHYNNHIDKEVFAALKLSLDNESFYEFHKAIFRKLKEEIAFIRKKIAAGQQQIKERKLGENDPEREEIQGELKNLRGIISSIKNRNTLEYLTNVGALPNYAFPETGVSLMARILGQQAEGSNKPPDNKEFDIVRSPAQAIKEFAPDNYFYSQGFRFEITGINTFDWGDTANYHTKRFCSECDHIEIETAQRSVQKNCPKCGHESWAASSNVHTFAMLTSVKSFNRRSDATLNDAKDEREALLYHINRHFKFDASASHGAWALRDIPFGIEFVSRVKITDVNLGRRDISSARKILMNEVEVPTHGFVTCKYCGKSSSHFISRGKGNKDKFKFHYGYCKHKSEEYKGKEDEVFAEVFFFREVDTEALKILLPVQELNGEAEVRMFQAGLNLGLKKYYNGNPQHIGMSGYREFNPKTLKFDRYLVLYDRVPGGTGYLSQLFKRDQFSRLLQYAYEGIANCNCQNLGKDGCYHCILSYSNQFYHSDLSRSRAEQRLAEIVRQTEGWELQPGGLSDISGSGRIEESELEDRFIRSLSKFAKRQNKWLFAEKNIDGVVNYTLEYSDPEKELYYEIKPQVDLGPVNGVAFHTRADFLMICTLARIKGEDHTASVKKVAIYLDGYQYHASQENNRFLRDFQKRKAINESQEYTTWTLTWADIEHFDEQFIEEETAQENRKDFLSAQLLKEDYIKTKRKLFQSGKKAFLDITEVQNSFERFIFYLCYPVQDEYFRYSWALYLAIYQKKLFVPSFAPDDWQHGFSAFHSESQYCKENRTLDGLIAFQGIPDNTLFESRTLVNLKSSVFKTKLAFKDTDSVDKESWNQFWILYNIFQFADIDEVDTFVETVSEQAVQTYTAEDMETIVSLFELPYRPLVRELFEKGFIKDESDEIALNSLVISADEVLEAELIIPHLKIVFEPVSEQHQRLFEQAGYYIKTTEQINDIQL